MKPKINENAIEILKGKIFNKRFMRKSFSERELKELLDNDNFYKPEQIWFTKETLEWDIPRQNQIFNNYGYDKVRTNTINCNNPGNPAMVKRRGGASPHKGNSRTNNQKRWLIE